MLEKVKVCKEVNNEQDVVFEVKTKPIYTCSYDTEQGRLMVSLASGPSKMLALSGFLPPHGHWADIQRNRIGTVKLNVAIANGMYCLEKVRVVVRRKVRKPKVVEVIQFYAVADEERGVECFMLKVKPEKLDILYEKLKEMGAEIKGARR